MSTCGVCGERLQPGVGHACSRNYGDKRGTFADTRGSYAPADFHGVTFEVRGAPPSYAALLSVFVAACALVDRDGPLVEADRTRDPLCVAVDAARGMTAREAIEERCRRDER